MHKLLVVDDEPNVLYSLQKGLESDTVQVITAPTGGQAIQRTAEDKPDAVILDVRLPDMSGLDVFDRLRDVDPRLPVVIITAYATTDTAIEAMKRGAFEYMLKPVDLHQLRDVVGKALETSRISHIPAVIDDATEYSEDTRADRIIGRSAAMQEVYKGIGRVASQDVNVLVLGESGTGKELVARAIFHHSTRADRPFLAINCAAIPEPLLESELFGHERGAFTGADRRRVGKFEQAHGGTIFLDEIGDMTLATQAKLLRLLQDGRFERLGGSETIFTDVRIIAATNKDPARLVPEGKFRSDLLYRLNDVTLTLPPLRERSEDIPQLVQHFLKVHGVRLEREGVTMTPEAMEVLMKHNWPGNIRELQSAVRYSMLHALGDLITVDCLPESVREERSSDGASHSGATGDLPDVRELVHRYLDGGQQEIYRDVVGAVDRAILEVVLEHCRGNQVHASQVLGISRTTLRAKLSALGLTVEKRVSETEFNQLEHNLDRN